MKSVYIDFFWRKKIDFLKKEYSLLLFLTPFPLVKPNFFFEQRRV
jgi:hypothetical protein